MNIVTGYDKGQYIDKCKAKKKKKGSWRWTKAGASGCREKENKKDSFVRRGCGASQRWVKVTAEWESVSLGLCVCGVNPLVLRPRSAQGPQHFPNPPALKWPTSYSQAPLCKAAFRHRVINMILGARHRLESVYLCVCVHVGLASV